MNAQRKTRSKSRIAVIRIDGQDAFSISRVVFNAIADEPLYNDTPGARLQPAITLRTIAASSAQDRCKRRRVLLPIGLIDRLKTMLGDAGWKISVRLNKHQLSTGPSPHSAVESKCTEFLRRAHGRRCALAEVASIETRFQIITDLRAISENRHILIVVKNKATAKRIAAELSALIGRRVTWGVEDRNSIPWTHVDCINTLTGRSVRDWSLLVFFDVELALSKTSLSQVSAMFGSARLGFSIRDLRHLPEIERTLIECEFGPIIYRQSDEWAGTEVTVDWLPASSYPARARANRLHLKRTNLWRNNARNRLIAQTAGSLERLDQPALRKLGLGEAVTWLESFSNPNGLSVAVAVENVEHGREIARHLPSWPLHAALPNEEVGQHPILDGNIIVTMQRAHQSILAQNVVIYAVGNGERWIDRLGPQCELLTGDRMLVIDVADNCDPETVRQVRCRRDDFRQRGWQR